MATKDEWQEIVMKTDGDTWDREDTIEGELLGVKNNVGPNSSNLYTLLTTKGEIGVWGSTVLDTKLGELSKGDQVKIEPLGKTKSPQTGREYWDFRVSYKPGTKQDPVVDVDENEEVSLSDVPFFRDL